MGTVTRVTNYASSDGKACIAMVTLPSGRPNNLNLEAGESIVVLAPNESFCTLFGQSKISKTQILVFIAQKITASSLPRAIQADPTVIWETFDIYRIFEWICNRDKLLYPFFHICIRRIYFLKADNSNYTLPLHTDIHCSYHQ